MFDWGVAIVTNSLTLVSTKQLQWNLEHRDIINVHKCLFVDSVVE